MLLLPPGREAWAAEAFSFNRAHLHGAAQVDLQKYQYGNPLHAGQYRSTLSVNGRDTREETFVIQEHDGQLEPCISPSLFDALQLKDAQWPTAATCLRFSQIDKAIGWEYDSGENVLRVNMPQALLQPHYRGGEPEKVDSGVPAAVLRYQANSYQSIVDGDTSSHHYLGLDASLRAFGWRLHHQSSYQAQEGNTHWDSIATWAERSVVNWASTLRLGQGWTDGTFFDSVSFIGGRLATDAHAAGLSRGFAPSVSGVARTNARVTVTQNGALLYEATVPPGKFTFDDLYPTNAGGDLQVTIHEADGSQTPLPCRTPRCLAWCRQARSIMICRWAIWMRTGSPGGRDLAKPRCSTASMTISAAIPALTRRQIITRRWSAAPSIPTGARWRSIFPFCGEGQGARLAGGLPLAGVRIKIVYIRYANAVLDEPQQRRQLSLHSRCRLGARPAPQRLAGDDPLQRDVVSAGRQRQSVI